MEVDYDTAKRNKVKIKHKNKPVIKGKTTDGKLVIGNLFFIVESQGVPLEECINKIYDSNQVIDWYDFYLSGEKSGWQYKTIIDRIKYGIEESFYPELKTPVISTIKRILYKKFTNQK